MTPKSTAQIVNLNVSDVALANPGWIQAWFTKFANKKGTQGTTFFGHGFPLQRDVGSARSTIQEGSPPVSAAGSIHAKWGPER